MTTRWHEEFTHTRPVVAAPPALIWKVGAFENVQLVDPNAAPHIWVRHAAPTVAVLPGNAPVTRGRREPAEPVATVFQVLFGWQPVTLLRSTL